MGIVTPGLIFLVAAYIMSQFYRAFLAVLAPELQADIGTTPADLSLASGLWFLCFASMQIPVGEALDRIGPRLTASVLHLLCGAGGAMLFAWATIPAHVIIAMALIGVGCSPVLMASYYIFARAHAPALFATLAGVTLGIGTFGNLAGSLPLTFAVEVVGWRNTMRGLAVLTGIIAIGIFVFVKDPPKTDQSRGGSVLTLLAMPVLWPILAIMAVNYVPAAAIRGLWAGPYLTDVFGAAPEVIGAVTLTMGLAMAAGNFIYGPLDRVLASRKQIILTGNLLGITALVGLVLFGGSSVVASTLLLAAVGITGASFVVIIAHARDFFPDHMTGRGVTLLNFFGMGGAGTFQALSGPVWKSAFKSSGDHGTSYQVLFCFFAAALAFGVLVYAFSREERRT
ncbi:MAG: MFS transporter [Rhodobacteraceae bacterium]|nr:MFS transporter [Paracoccaceae bacterium]